MSWRIIFIHVCSDLDSLTIDNRQHVWHRNGSDYGNRSGSHSRPYGDNFHHVLSHRSFFMSPFIFRTFNWIRGTNNLVTLNSTVLIWIKRIPYEKINDSRIPSHMIPYTYIILNTIGKIMVCCELKYTLWFYLYAACVRNTTINFLSINGIQNLVFLLNRRVVRRIARCMLLTRDTFVIAARTYVKLHEKKFRCNTLLHDRRKQLVPSKP